MRRNLLYFVPLSACFLGFVMTSGCTEEKKTESSCTDGIDNDGNGLTDCDDPACADLAICQGPECGDGVAEGTEECDGDDLGNATCVGEGFDGGELGCNPTTCTFDTSGCTTDPICGDGVIDTGEECDGTDFAGATCLTLGHTGGDLACSPATCLYDETGCTDAPDCTGILSPNDCVTCLEANCCPELATCNGTAGCIACLTGDQVSCDANNQAAVEAVGTCAQNGCSVECSSGPTVEPVCDAPATASSAGSCVTVGGNIQCNPVTNDPCGAGEACDLGSAGGYECYPPPNEQVLCADCGETAGWCEGAETCVMAAGGRACARYCCDASDCGSGTCDTTTLGLPGGVGVCVVAP